MDLQTTKRLLKFLYRAQVATGVRTPLFMWGGSGIGKTEIGRQASRELSSELYGDDEAIKYTNMRLAVKVDAGDLLGLQYNVEVFPCPACGAKNGRDGGRLFTQNELRDHLEHEHNGIGQETLDRRKAAIRTVFSAPRDLPMNGPAFLMLDELNRANRAILDASFTLLEDGRAGVHQLPIDVFVFCAGNPPTDDYLVQDVDQDRAFMERAIHIIVEPTVDEWMEYAYATNHNVEVIRAVAGFREFLGENSVSDEFLAKIRPSPRSMSKVSHLLNQGLMQEFEPDDVVEILGGIIGRRHAQLFRARVMDTEQPVDADDVVNRFDQVAERILAYGVEGRARYDLLNMTNYALFKLIKDARADLTEIQYRNIGRYILALPKDLAVAVMRMFTRDGREAHQFRHLLRVVELVPEVKRMLRAIYKEQEEGGVENVVGRV
jgi:hypothetical protein